MSKRRWIAVSVTTEEAFDLCLSEGCLLIAVETPLYPEIKKHWTKYTDIADYEITEYEKQKFIMLKKVRGAQVFDDAKFDIFYFPLNYL